MGKTKISWFFFVLNSITYLALVVCCGMLLSEKLGLGQWWQIVLISAGLLLCAFLIFWGFRATGLKLAVRRSRRSYRRKGHSFFVMEMVPVALIYSVTLLARIFWMNIIEIKLTGNVRLLLRACIGQPFFVDTGFSFHGITWLYEKMLTGLCWFFGNNMFTVYILNLLIQIVSVFLGYALLRILVNRKAAIAYTILFNLVPIFYESLALCDPIQLYLMFVLIFLIVMARLSPDEFLRPPYVKRGYLYFVLYGLLTGILLFGDLFSVFLLLTGCVMLSLRDEKTKFRYLWYGIGVLIGIGCAVLGGAMIVFKETNNSSIWECIQSYVVQYAALYRPKAAFLKYPVVRWELWIVILAVLSGLPIALQWKNKKDHMVWLGLIYPGLLIAMFTRVFYMEIEPAFAYIFLIMICVGIGMIFEMQNPLKKPVTEPAEAQYEEAQNDEKQNKAEPETVLTEKSASEEIQPVEKTVHFIENPLPLPKKHVRKEMDYQYEVPEEKMVYDIDVKDTDDFDI